MSNCTEENKLSNTSNCHTDGGCGSQAQISCCGYVDPAQENLFNDDVEIKQRIYNERKLIKENEKIYKEFRKDFNPLLWGLAGLMIGTVIGTTVEKVLMIGADVTYTAIFGLFLGVTICINKNRTNNRNQVDNL